MEFLTRKVRLAIMGFLILCFFISAPLILFYTAGYRYNFLKGEIKQTGVLSVEAEPKNMNVSLNEVKVKNKMPIYLPNRAPGTYKIKLSLDGYKTWEKDITIESKKTTYIKEITLFKESAPKKILKDFKGEIQNVFPSPSGNYLFILSGNLNDITEITLYQPTTEQSNTIFRGNLKEWPKISWSPFNDYAIIITKNNNDDQVQLIDPTSPGIATVKTFSDTITNWYWQKNSFNPAIYLQEKENIILLSNNTKQNVGATTSSVWYIDGQINWSYDDTQKCLRHLLNDFNGNRCLISLPEKIENIIDADSNRLVLKTLSGLLLVSLENNNIKESKNLNTTNILYNRQTNEWLTWSDFELWTIYPNGTTALLNRTGEKINFVNPLDNYGVLLLASENKITGFNPGYYVTHELLNNVKLNSIGADIENRKIYFFGELASDKGIYELEY